MEFPWKNQPEPEPEPTPEPTDPILPCGVEKVTVEGEEILFDKARFVHSLDGTVLQGYIVEPLSGHTTDVKRMVFKNSISRHVAMGWRNSDKSLHEMLGELPYSLYR